MVQLNLSLLKLSKPSFKGVRLNLDASVVPAVCSNDRFLLRNDLSCERAPSQSST